MSSRDIKSGTFSDESPPRGEHGSELARAAAERLRGRVAAGAHGALHVARHPLIRFADVAARRSGRPPVASGIHPRTTVLELTGGEHFPDEVVRDMERFRSPRRLGQGQLRARGAAALRGRPGRRGRALLRTGLALCPSIGYLERAWQDATRGAPADAAYVEIEVASAVDPTLTDHGSRVRSLFTQYGPHDESGWPEGAREAYGERCLQIVARHAPNVKAALIHHEVLAPPDLESVFGLHGGSIFECDRGAGRWRSRVPRRCSPSTRRR